MSPLGITNVDVKTILSLITGFLSFFGCLWVFFCISKALKPRPVSLKLILWLAIADFIYSIANILSAFDSEIAGLCTFEALIRIFSVISSLFWATCIAISTYQTLMKGREFQQDVFFKRALIIGFIVPVLYALSPLIVSHYAYGPQTFGCYVTIADPIERSQVAKLIIILIYDGLPVIVALSITIPLYILIAKKVNEFSEGFLFGPSISIRRLFWFPMVIFLAYIPSFIDNLIELYSLPAAESYTFTTIHIILTHTVGLTSALVFSLQRKKYYEVCDEYKVKRNSKMISLCTLNTLNKSTSMVSDEGSTRSYSRNSCSNELIQASMIGAQ